jgi:pilus assembly protein CpaC
LGFDFSKVTGSNVVSSGITGLIAPLDQAGKTGLLNSASSGVVGVPVLGPPGPGTETFVFGVVNGTSAFFGILEALRQDNLAKIMAEPTLVTISGRPAYFNVGGEFPVPVPQSLGTISIDFKKYGTQLDFVPVVLGHGRIRLEVRPRITELDPSRSITVAGTTVPGLRSREVETGVELQAGQSLAIAGLVQHRVEAINRGLPWLSDLPVVGALFRNVREESNEVELLIMVTPELVDAMDPQDVPPCGPGMETRSPNDCELYLKGFLEVPNCNSNCNGQNCQTGPECQDSSGATEPVEANYGKSEVRIARRDNPPIQQIRKSPANPNSSKTSSSRPGGDPSFIGPIGYDVLH